MASRSDPTGPYDIAVVGGGPAGATTAARLAQRGLRVLVLEKERFPRFHIGESLLPASVPTLAALGVDVNGPAFRYKGGAEFFDEVRGDYALYPFADRMPGGAGPGHSYQVDRAPFDLALLDAARELGAEVHQGERCVDADVTADAVTVTTDVGSYRARYFVDATGQDAFFARRDRTTVRVDDFGRAAIFTHYASLSDEALEELGPDGNIRVLMHDDGWSWVIPLPQRRLSVGTVTRHRKATPEALDAVVATSPMLGKLTRGASRADATVTRNFSYRNTVAAGSRFACVGDSACFIDPVFSSGVALALLGAERLVADLAPALEAGSEDDPALTESLQAHMSHAYSCMGALVHGFYHTRMVKNLFFARRPDPAMRSGLITMLTGDLWRDDNPFQNALLASRRRMTAVE